MEELIEVKLTRREIAMLADVMGTTGFRLCDNTTSEVSDQLFDKLVTVAGTHDIPVGWKNIGCEDSQDGTRFIVDSDYTVRNV